MNANLETQRLSPLTELLRQKVTAMTNTLPQVTVSLLEVRTDYVLPQEICQLPSSIVTACDKRKYEAISVRIAAFEAMKGLRVEPLIGPWVWERPPHWPEFLKGSLSHCEDVAAAVVGESDKWIYLGIDVEKQLSIEKAKKIERSILLPQEKIFFSSQAHVNFETFVTLVFSAKEAAYKAIHPITKIFMGFHDVELVSLTHDAWEIKILKSTGWNASVRGTWVATKTHILTLAMA